MLESMKHSTCAGKSNRIIEFTAGVKSKLPMRRSFLIVSTIVCFSVISMDLLAQELTSKQRKMLKDFEDAAHEINRSLPARVGAITGSRVTVGPGLRFTNYFIAHGIGETGGTSKINFSRTTELVTVETVCKDSDVRKAIRQGMAFHYVYKSTDGSILAQFVVDRERCQ